MITQEQLAQAILELKESQKQTDRQIKETNEQMKQTDKKLDKLAKLFGNVGNNQGDVAEEFFYNSLESKPTLAGINYDFIDKNITRSKKGLKDEFDIVLINGKDIAIIETKYKAHTADVKKLITKKYDNFKKLYPEYKEYTHHLGLASFHMNDDVKALALENNVMLLQRKGDIIETIVP